MDTLTARPGLLKQANLSLIRRTIKAKGTASRADIANETRISSTTVRSLLAEMMQNGEIESVGYDESSGGRKAELYRFVRDRYHGAAVCMTDNQLHGLVVNVCGEISDIFRLDIQDGDYERAMISFLDELVLRREIKSIGVGVPGAVEKGCFWRKNDQDELCRDQIGDILSQRYGLPVVLENDLNAIAIGFGRRYQKEFQHEDPENTNMAYLHFEKGCVSAGFIAGGRVIRGSRNFAGELGLIPAEGDKLLDDCISEPMDDVQFTNLAVKIIGWICGILNPQYVALGGPCLRKSCVGPIGDGLSSLLPKHMIAEVLYTPDIWHDYYDGMAYLTAGKMFDEIQFIKE